MELNNYGYILEKEYTFKKKLKVLTTEQNCHYVLLKVLYCGICGSDYSCYIGRRNEYPKSLGHELVAEIIQTGENVSDFCKGDIVVTDLNYRCGECCFCLSSKSHLCVQNDIELFSNRGFYQYISIHESYLVKLPKIEKLYRYTLIEPLSCVIHAFDSLSYIPSSILINGCGSIGMLSAFYAKYILGINEIYIRDTISEKECLISEHFSLPILANQSTEKVECFFECSNTVSGAEYVLNEAQNGALICFMSHLYGENTSFIYDFECKKELVMVFPLRNGEKKNLLSAHKYITSLWIDKYDNMIAIWVYNDINEVFNKKGTLKTSCKQVLKITSK